MITLVDLSSWKKQKEILLDLNRDFGIKVSSRTWRSQVEKWNKMFADGEVDYYITHSNRLGFKATRNYKEAVIGRNDYLKRAFDMLRKARDCDKAFGNLQNFKFDFEKGEII